MQKVPKWSLVDYSAVKGWFDYSHNRTMSGLKLANAADIKAAELEKKYKNQGKDWNQIVVVIAILVIVSVVAFMLILQFGNISEVSNQLSECSQTRAEARGNLNVCQGQLKEYEPIAREITPEIDI